MKSPSLHAVLSQRYGDAVVDRVREAGSIPLGLVELDSALFGVGIPGGRIVEILGDHSSGKTKLALHVAGQFHRAGKTVVHMDPERTTVPADLLQAGLPVDDSPFVYPRSAQEAFSILQDLCTSGVADLVIVDSAAALAPAGGTELADVMSSGLRDLNAACGLHNTTVLFTNQVRMHQSQETLVWEPVSASGRALSYYASIRLETRVVAQEFSGEGDDTCLERTAVGVRVLKNKPAKPGGRGVFALTDSGVDLEYDLVRTAVRRGVAMTRREGLFSFQGKRLGEKPSEILATAQHLGVLDPLLADIRASLFTGPQKAA